MNSIAPTTQPIELTPSPYLTIEHWRGIAALMVFLFHTTLVKETMTYPLQGAIQWITRYGYYGVHIFFVISGYCIASNVSRLVLTGQQPTDFLRNRLLRIYPTYWAACLITILMALVCIPITHIHWLNAFPPSITSAIANLFLTEPYVGHADPFLSVSWTLVYEIGFYLLVALGFWFYRMGCRVNLLIDIGLGLAVLGLLHLPFRPLYILSLWNEFVMGGLVFLALYYQKFSRFHERLCLAGIVALAVTSWCLANPGSILFSITAAFALLLYYLHRWDAPLSQSRWLAPFNSLGLFSYSLYLFHGQLVSRVLHIAGYIVDPNGSRFLIAQIIVWIGCLLGSWIFYKLCEQPLEKWRRSLRPPTGIRDSLILG